jgi:hypothetical protein
MRGPIVVVIVAGIRIPRAPPAPPHEAGKGGQGERCFQKRGGGGGGSGGSGKKKREVERGAGGLFFLRCAWAFQGGGRAVAGVSGACCVRASARAGGRARYRSLHSHSLRDDS